MPLDPAMPLTDVKNVIVHKLTKQDDKFTPELRPAPNAVSPTTSKVVSLLVKEYARRSGKAHGRFNADEINYPVQQHLRKYFVDQSISFHDASVAMMATLCAEATGTAATPGGVIIAHVESDGVESVLVAIVTEEWGAAMSANLDFAEADYLDLKGFRFAGKINLTEWQQGGEKYVSLLRGKSRDVSSYFMSFLGCDDTVTDTAETKTLKIALEDFVKRSALNEVQSQEFFDKAYDICEKLRIADSPIDLQAFANELWPADPDKLTEIFSEPDRKLSDGFYPSKRIFRGFVQFSGKTKNWKVEFSREAIKSGDVVFVPENETLIINNLPPDLKQRLRDEQRDDE